MGAGGHIFWVCKGFTGGDHLTNITRLIREHNLSRAVPAKWETLGHATMKRAPLSFTQCTAQWGSTK